MEIGVAGAFEGRQILHLVSSRILCLALLYDSQERYMHKIMIIVFQSRIVITHSFPTRTPTSSGRASGP